MVQPEIQQTHQLRLESWKPPMNYKRRVENHHPRSRWLAGGISVGKVTQIKLRPRPLGLRNQKSKREVVLWDVDLESWKELTNVLAIDHIWIIHSYIITKIYNEIDTHRYSYILLVYWILLYLYVIYVVFYTYIHSDSRIQDRNMTIMPLLMMIIMHCTQSLVSTGSGLSDSARFRFFLRHLSTFSYFCPCFPSMSNKNDPKTLLARHFGLASGVLPTSSGKFVAVLWPTKPIGLCSKRVKDSKRSWQSKAFRILIYTYIDACVSLIMTL